MSVSRVADLTVDELRALIREEIEDLVREAVREALVEFNAESDDPDAGLTLKPGIVERLQAYSKARPKGRPLDDIARKQ